MVSSLLNSNIRVFSNPNKVRDINNRLSSSLMQARPLKLSGLSFKCVFLHIGPGVYESSIDPGVHQHPELQLEFILDGDFEFEIENTVIEISGSRGLFIPPNTTHTWRCLGKGSIFGAMIEVSGHNSGNFFQKLKKRQHQKSCTFKSDDANKFVHELFSTIIEEKRQLWSIEKLSMLTEIWLLECIKAEFELLKWIPAHENIKKAPRRRSKEVAENVMEFLESNFMHNVNLENIALQIGMSSRQANRIFKQQYNETISQALVRIRLDRAIKMLQSEDDLPIKAVAFNTGFSSTSYFTRCFREAFGMSPKYVRKGDGLKVNRR